MKVFFIIFAAILVAVYGQEIVSDEYGQEFYLVPAHRVRRQLKYDIQKGSQGGVIGSLGYSKDLINNNNHRLTAGGTASKQFHPSGPLSLGGDASYLHKPSGSGLDLGAVHTKNYGTDFNANGRYNLGKTHKGNIDWRLDAVGGYQRHYGGPGGTGKPNWNAGLNLNGRF